MADSLATSGPPRIAVVGSFVQAVCWQLPRLPAQGESLQASGFFSEPAGKGLAVAVGCRRLGAEVDLLLSIGDDAAGNALLERLEAEALSTRHVVRAAGRSGHGAGWLAADGANAIAVFSGANDRLDAAQVARADAALAGASLVYAQLETPLAAALEAFTRARRHGALTVLNPSPWRPLPEALLACTQVLLVNETEVVGLVRGWPDDATADPEFGAAQVARIDAALPAFWAAWPGTAERLLVVTLGARGSMAFAPDGTTAAVPALAVDARDSIGAGDAFAAGWCTARTCGATVIQSLQAGNACGAHAVSHPGILTALPRAAELEGWRWGPGVRRGA